MSSSDELSSTRACLTAALDLSRVCITALAAATDHGKRIDDYQVTTERVVYAATELKAAELLLMSAEKTAADKSPMLGNIAAAACSELIESATRGLAATAEELGPHGNIDAAIAKTDTPEFRKTLRVNSSEARFREIGRWAAEDPRRNPIPVDEMNDQIRQSVREFADREVAPRAEHIHVNDELVPEEFITQIGELGYFGLSIPEQYGGNEMGNLPMIITTEELSRASLAAAGSLITRPEILAKALLNGGTEAQKEHWLPKLASGEVMVGISVTEPDVGSNVAGLKCRAERAEVGGEKGWVLRGTKAWCTFAGRANILAVLARTDPDMSKGAKGLSLFIVPKDSFDGHEFEMTQPTGGKMLGKADRTLGYRGMHSFGLTLDDYFVPEANLVGGAEQEGRGFYLQMAGFAAGRLQTAGRATGVGQAAIETTARYVTERSQFNKPLIDFQLTQYKLGRMVSRVAASRVMSYEAALQMDEDERAASRLAAQAKLLSCDIAVEVTQEGQLLHGGWGYAEEYAISRYVVDALVLPIFEGVKPVLELKVVARDLLRRPK